MALPTSPSEIATLKDRVTGVEVRQLTNYRGHSFHLYFTNNGWWDGGRQLLFASDRGNRRNLYSLTLATGEITRITDADDGGYQGAFLNPTRDEAFFWRGSTLRAVDLRNGLERVVYERPDDWVGSSFSCTADGRWLVMSMHEPVDLGFKPELGAGYIGFSQLFEAHPRSRILRVPVGGTGDAEVLHEERNWIGHVNASPTRPDLVTFCHEGPWTRVDQRIWGLNLNDGGVWKIRPQKPGEALGHEYWLADGETVGYHGRSGDQPVHGFTRYDNTDSAEAPFSHSSNHFHSNTRDLIVGDGVEQQTPYILLWRFDGERFDGPRVLCIHRCSRHWQVTHVHPRFSPDEKQVLYTSDHVGYGNLYLVDLPPFESLPRVEEVKK